VTLRVALLVLEPCTMGLQRLALGLTMARRPSAGSRETASRSLSDRLNSIWRAFDILRMVVWLSSDWSLPHPFEINSQMRIVSVISSAFVT